MKNDPVLIAGYAPEDVGCHIGTLLKCSLTATRVPNILRIWKDDDRIIDQSDGHHSPEPDLPPTITQKSDEEIKGERLHRILLGGAKNPDDSSPRDYPENYWMCHPSVGALSPQVQHWRDNRQRLQRTYCTRDAKPSPRL